MKFGWRQNLACSPAGLIALCQLRNFQCEFTEKCFVVLTNQATWFISRGIGRSYFSENFLLSFLLCYDFKILVKSRAGGSFLCLGSSVNVWQAKCLIFHFFKAGLNNFETDLCKNQQKTLKFPSFFYFFYLVPCMAS